MKKTILILSTLLAGGVSFASQSIPQQISCTVVTYTGNIQVKLSSANCKSVAAAATIQYQYINLDESVISKSLLYFDSLQP